MAQPRRPGVVLLAGPGPLTNIIFHALDDEVGPVTVVLEQPVSRPQLLKRRVRRLGLPTVTGQVLFLVLVVPLLARTGRGRVEEILTSDDLDVSPVPDTRIVRVPSVNSPDAVRALADLVPAVVVVSGTRIISGPTLDSVEAPFVNMHAGVTPQYRGVHGGYWALAEGRGELAGTTVHLVDTGIDTGPILGQATFAVTRRDSFTTYPYLHAAVGVPVLVDVVRRLAAGEPAVVQDPLSTREPSRLRSHPTIWEYARIRRAKSVR